MNATTQKSSDICARRSFVFGAAVLVAVTVVSRILSIVSASAASGGASVVVTVLTVVINILNSAIFAAGAGLICHFLIKKDTRWCAISFFAAIIILTLDYAVLYIIDLVSGNLIGGLELITAVYVFLNALVRGITYVLIILFCRIFLRGASASTLPAPIVSKTHPFCRAAAASSVLRMIPYIINELFANVKGIITYGWDLTSSDVISILYAYGEIIVDGIVVYLTMYILLIALFSTGKATK